MLRRCFSFMVLALILVRPVFAQLDDVRASVNEFYTNLLSGKCEAPRPDCVSCTHSGKAVGVQNLSDDMNSVEFRARENDFFNRARGAQIDQISCQTTQLHKMRKRDVKSIDFQQQVLSDLAEKLPELRLRHRTHLASKAKIDQILQWKRNVEEARGAAASIGLGDETLKRYQKMIADEMKIYRAEAAKFSTLFSSLWRFDDPAMEGFILRQIDSSRDPQELLAESLLPATGSRIYQWATGRREFSFQEQVLDQMLEQAQKDLSILKKAGEPDFSTKKMLVRDTEWSSLLQGGSVHDNAILMCKLDRRYVSGDEKLRSHALNAAAMAPFGVGVFAKLMSAGKFLRLLTPAAQRAVLSNSQTLATASLYLSGIGAPVVVSEVKNACFDDRPQFAYSGPRTCNAHTIENFHHVERKRVEQENCILAMTMAALVATPPVLKYISKYRNSGVRAKTISDKTTNAQEQARAVQIRKYLDETAATADESPEIIVTARRLPKNKTLKGIDDFMVKHRASPDIRLVVKERVTKENAADFKFILEKNPAILKDKAKLDYVLDELTGIHNYSKAQRQDVLRTLSMTLVKWNPKSIKGKLIAMREAKFQRDMKKTQEWYRKNNPGEDEVMLARLARQDALLKRQQKLTLIRQCKSSMPNATNAKAGALSVSSTEVFGVASTGMFFAWANWNETKDATFAKRLGYEVVMAYVLSKLGGKIAKSQSSNFANKIIQQNAVGFTAATVDSAMYSEFFNGDEKKAEEHLRKIASNPNFARDLKALNDYLDQRSGIEEYIDQVTDISDNLVRAVFGRKQIKDLTPAEIQALDQNALKDPLVMERLMDTIGDKIYSDKLGGNTWGNSFIDRLSFDTAWNLSPAGVPRSVVAGILAYQAMCRNLDDPVKAFAAFGTIQIANRAIGSGLYYSKKSSEIGQ